MDWIIGMLIGLAVMVPMFIKLWRADSPRDKEDDKILLGALD